MRRFIAAVKFAGLVITGIGLSSPWVQAQGDENDAASLSERIGGFLPAWMSETLYLFENWKWLALFLVIALGVLVDRVFVTAVHTIVRKAFERDHVRLEGDVIRRALRPFGMVVMALVWGVAIGVLGFEEKVDNVFGIAIRFVAMAAGVWGAVRLVDLLTAVMAEKAKGTSSKLDDLLIPLVRRALKIFLFAFGVLFVASNLGTDISSILAGLGLGGLAFALAAQDTVKNLFGTLTVVLDRTYNVGDWVKIGSTEGTVEHVGFRSTRVRTFYDSVMTVPNSTLITATIDNMGERKFRRWSTRLGLSYDTSPEKIEAFCEGVRQLVRMHPYTRKDSYHVYLNGFGDSALEIMLYIFHLAPDWATELRERHRLMVDILKLANDLDVDLAFPTQTIHLRRDAPGQRKSLSDDADPRQHGRDVASKLVRDSLGDPPSTPPPVVID